MAALSRFWSLACGLGLPAAAAVLSATGQQSGLPAASFALSAGFLGAAGSIWQNLYAGSRQQREGEEAAERQRIFNHDLAKAVARSIATLLVPLTRSSSLPEQERKALRTMAEHAQVVWLRVIETDAPAFEPLLEENLADSIAANPNDPALGPYGDIRMWRDLLTRMAGETGPGVAKALTGDCAAIHEASKRCQQEFARQFFNDLKHDFATKGQAFAAVHLRMMGELIVLVREQARFNSELRARFDTIVDAVSNRGEEVVAWIGDDSAKGHRRLASLRPVTTWLKTIDARLGAIDNKVGQILQALRRIEKQGVRTEQTIQRESTRLHAQLEEEGKATRRRFRPVLIGLLSVLLVAMVFGGIYLFTSRKQTTMLHDSTESARRAALLGEQARDRLDSINAYLRLHLDDVSVANNSTPGFHSAIELVVESLAEEGELPQETWRTLTRFEVALITNSQADLDALSRLGRIEWTKSPITYEVTFADAVRFVCEAAGVPLRPLQQAEDELGDCYYFMEDEMEPLSDFRGTAYDLLNEVTRVAFADFCSVDWGLDKGAIVFGSRVNLFESESRAITNAIWRPSDLADAFERFGSNYLYDIGDSVTPVPSEGYAIARRHLEKALSLNKDSQRFDKALAVLEKLATLESFSSNSQAQYGYCMEAIPLADKYGTPDDAVLWRIRAGDTRRQLDDVSQASALYREALALATRASSPNMIARSHMRIGWIELESDRVEEAEASFNRSLAVAQRLKSDDLLANCLYSLGVSAALRSDLSSAKDFNDRARAIWTGSDNSTGAAAMMAWQYRDDGAFWSQRNKPAVARFLWESAAEIYLANGMEQEFSEVQALIDLVDLE